MKRPLIHSVAPLLCALPVALTLSAPQALAQSTALPAASSAEKPAKPATAAVLVADRVQLQGRDRLIAEGAVEALHGTTRLKASRIIYDRRADTLDIEGPITLLDGDLVVILADAAQLDADMQNGLLRGARMVMDQQVQLAAYKMDRVGGRYTQLYKVAATSCRVCNSDAPPLWQIRAQRVIHDQQEKQLYFDNAQLRVMDMPIFWLPRLRLPDPTLDRATGFLIPSLKQNSQLGLGVKVPYFFRLGDHRDLTLTPYLSPHTKTLEWRYRQAFRTGTIEFNGAISDDNIGTKSTRGYVFGKGLFNLRDGYELTFDIEAVTDKAYLVDYDYSDKDRLDSEIAVTRARRDEYFRGALISYQTLRDGENNSTLPTIIGDVTYERRYFPQALGGELRLALNGHTHYRYSDLDIAGRDMSRIDGALEWRRNWTLNNGIRATTQLGLAVDSFWVKQDSTARAQTSEITPSAAVTLRWPWTKTTASGATHVIEPILMMGWTGGENPNIPNDESTRVEFDEGNLLSLSRFPAPDRRERGLQGVLGLNWSRHSADSWNGSLTMGKVIRETAHSDFSISSGLSDTESALLLAGQLKLQNGMSLTARTLLDNGFDVTKAEARAGWQNQRAAFGASYIWLGADPAEDRASTISEWSLDGSYRFSRHWTGLANWRYDVASSETAEAGLGLQYQNECVEMTLSLSRRFTSSTIVEPSTDFGFTVALKGFSASTSDKSYTRTCGKQAR